MKVSIRNGLAALGILALCLPLGFFAAILLFPLWSWLEDLFGIEAVGHSGPAEWCFWLTYGLLASVLLLAYWRIARGGLRSP